MDRNYFLKRPEDSRDSVSFILMILFLVQNLDFLNDEPELDLVQFQTSSPPDHPIFRSASGPPGLRCSSSARRWTVGGALQDPEDCWVFIQAHSRTDVTSVTGVTPPSPSTPPPHPSMPCRLNRGRGLVMSQQYKVPLAAPAAPLSRVSVPGPDASAGGTAARRSNKTTSGWWFC